MKKQIMKKMAAVSIVAVMLLSMAGCGEKADQKEKMNESTNKDTKEMVFQGTVLEPKRIKGEISAFAVQKDTLYINTKEGQEEETDKDNTEETGEDKAAEKTMHRIYTANVDGSGVKEIYSHEFEKNQLMSNLVVGDDGSLTFLLQEEVMGKEKKPCFIMQVDAEGNELLQEDVTNILKLSQADAIIRVLQDNNKHLMIATRRSVYVLDESGKLLCEVKSDSGNLVGAAKTKEGSIVCAISGAEGEKVQVLDIAQEKWGESINLGLQHFEITLPLMDGMEYDFYYKDNSGIYGYDMEEEKNTRIIDYLASNLGAESTVEIIPIQEDQLMGAVWKEEGQSSLVFYKKVDPSKVADKTTITYGSPFGVSTPVENAVIAFNKQSKKYKVEIKDYLQEEEPIAKLNMDIITGNAPDIIDLDLQSIEQYVEKGVLEDLTPYYEKDSDLKTEGLIPSVAEAMQVDGKYYYVAPFFNVYTIAGSSKDVGTEKGWTFEEMKAVIQEKGEGVRPFYDENKLNFLYCFSDTCSDFVDWKTGICSFDSQDFKDMLEFCNTGKNTEETEEAQPRDLIKKGEVLFSDGQVTMEMMHGYTEMFNKEGFTFIGYPNEEKQGNFFEFFHPAGIYAKSEVKEGAWEFLRILMTKEFQGIHDNNPLVWGNNPTRQDCFDMHVKAKTTTEPYTDELGQEITPLKTPEGFELDPWLIPLTQEEADQYIDLINSTKRCKGYNPFLMNIIEEEALIYFAGEKSLEEIVDIIQDRMTTYVNENR